MESAYSPRARAERLIAACRVVLAIFSLLAIWVDPSEPANYAPIAYTILAAYVVYAILIAAVVWASAVELGRLGFTTHVVDLVVFTSFLYFAAGPTSPFFVYFIFSVCCGALRWQRCGTLWTAIVVLGLSIAMGLYIEFERPHDDSQITPFIIRCVYLTIVALVLTYLTTYEDRVRNELAKLAGLPFRDVASYDPETFICETLKYASDVLDAPRVLMLWEEEEEPFRHVACLSADGFQWNLEAPSAFDPPVAAALDTDDFLSVNARAKSPEVLQSSSAGFRSWRGEPLNPELIQRFDIQSVVAAKLRGEDFHGRLLFLDKPGMTSDDLILGGIVAHQVTAFLNQLYLHQHLQHAAVMNERIKMSRDLHDGVLQSLTGIALQVEMVRRLVDTDSQAATMQLAEIQTLIVDEQRSLRSFIQRLKTEALPVPEQNVTLGSRLIHLAEKIERQWGIDVDLTIEPTQTPLPSHLIHEILFLTQESLANAARHSGASEIHATVAVVGGQVHITVSDNGQGFPFKGRYNLDAMMAKNLGPRSLKGRIASLGGQLAIDSSASGTCLEMSLPLQPHRKPCAPPTAVKGNRAYRPGSHS